MLPVLSQNLPLLGRNTFRIAATAATAWHIASAEDLMALHAQGLFSEPYLVLGGGSNVLFLQDPIMPILLMDSKGIALEPLSDDEALFHTAAGENWHQVVLHTLELGYGGLENLSLIPGTTGAAPIQNIGAYGVELKDVLVSVRALDLTIGQMVRIPAEDCQFGYRSSIFKYAAKGRYIITEVTLRLHKQAPLHLEYGAIKHTLAEQGIAQPTHRDVSNVVIQIRSSKLPDPKEIGNGGSFFMNPTISAEAFERFSAAFPTAPHFPAGENQYKIPAAWLIEQCGWKGYRAGDVGCYPLQPLVLVNYGSGTGAQVLQLAQQIIASVQERFQITLVPEINLV